MNRRGPLSADSNAVDRDAIGSRSEAIAFAALTDFDRRKRPLFRPAPLGEKCPTFDFLVELLDSGSTPVYFLAQVKGTRRGLSKDGDRLNVQIAADDVWRLARCRLPAYVIGVDERTKNCYLASLAGLCRVPLSGLTTRHPLTPVVLRRLRAEVRARWRALPVPRKDDTAFAF